MNWRKSTASRCATRRASRARTRRPNSPPCKEGEAPAPGPADVAVVAAYGLILPKPVLEAPRLGCLNIHGSLLPRWRGAAPIQRAILAGDHETGITIMRMDEGLDTGPMLCHEAIPSAPPPPASSCTTGSRCWARA